MKILVGAARIDTQYSRIITVNVDRFAVVRKSKHWRS